MPRGRGRGGRGRYGGGIPRGVYYADPMGIGMGMPGVRAPIINRNFQLKKHSFRIPFKAIEDGTIEYKLIPVNPGSLECFHGYQSIFSTQYHHDFVVDGKTYKSVDHYYQRKKVEQITGTDSERFDDPKVKNFGNLAREILKLHNISRKSIDQWRVSCGVEIVQKALLERVKQSPELKDALIKTGDKIIVHTFANDDFFGAGCPFKYVKDWSAGMEKNKIQVKFPMVFPLTPETVQHCPIFAKGRNVLGVILMILREKVLANQLDNLSVTLSPIGKYVVPETYTPRPMKANGASISRPGDIDFTMDYEEVDSIAAASQGVMPAAAAHITQTNPAQAQQVKPAAAAAVPVAGAATTIPGATGKVKVVRKIVKKVAVQK